MKVALDLNVVLDVVQNRLPHYQDSADVLSRARTGDITAVLPSHAVTTLYYVLTKAAGQLKADETVDWLLAHFEVGVADKAVFRRARLLSLGDFEDAVVASVAEATHCDYVVTRNVSDFAGSPVPAVSPTDFLAVLAQLPTPPANPQQPGS